MGREYRIERALETNLKLDLRVRLISYCHKAPLRVDMEIISEVWEGPSQAAKGPSAPTLRDPVSLQDRRLRRRLPRL